MIYIITHKMFDNSISKSNEYKVLHVGNNLDTSKEYLNDNTLDNISFKNKNYCELTGVYWLWKNSSDLDSDPIGIVHYRRYFVTKLTYFFYYFFNLKPKVIKLMSLQEFFVSMMLYYQSQSKFLRLFVKIILTHIMKKIFSW